MAHVHRHRQVEADAERGQAGRPHPSPTVDRYCHFFNVTPGRYSASAAVELGSGMERGGPAAGPRKVLFAAKGEWTGKLKTGVVTVALFQDAGK
ncbi:MAG TPA: hypothetical protein PK867_27825 [Pirellulales bacterium]|nr:hypothetical protein [Pirellulales bacterium]